MGQSKALLFDFQCPENQYFEDERSINKRYGRKLFREVSNDNQLIDLYFSWLCRPIQVEDRDFSMLFAKLHAIEFTWFVPNDDNRISDGEKLRENFIEAANLGLYELSILHSFPCSFLELMIGLSLRMDDIMGDLNESDNINGWFWELIENMGLCNYSNENFHSLMGHMVIWDKAQLIISRGYGRKGDGGLFPLQQPRQDQRKVELWYQMNLYLEEKYKIDKLI
jgi:hypothetical protein